MIELRKVSKSYGEIHALREIDIRIAKGELHGLVSPNGAGKTTSINILTSYLKPDSGEIFYNDRKIDAFSIQQKKEIGYIPQELAIYEDLTAAENLQFWGKLYDIPQPKLKQKTAQLLDLVGLTGRKDDAVKTYSGGMKRRINLAVGLIHDPEIIFLDEPTVGVDPQSRNLIFELIESIHAEGKTILYTSHYMEEVERLCQRISIIDHGTVIADGTKNEILKSIGNESEVLIEVNGSIQRTDLHDSDELIVISENAVRIQGNDLATKLQEYMKDLEKAGRKITNLSLHKPVLETVFLKLTGRELRE